MKLAALAELIGARLLGDADLDVGRVRAVDEAGEGDLGFAHAANELKAAYSTKATALLVEEGFAADHAHELPCAVLAASPASRALAKAIDALHPLTPAELARRGQGGHIGKMGGHEPHVHASAFVEPTASLGAGTIVEALAYVGPGVVVGRDCRIGPGAVLLHATLGDRVVVGPNSVVGDEGFVFAPEGDENLAVRHIAGVIVEDDVELGACVTIDRGALRDTRVGRGTKIDNHAQIGHDVVVGQHVVVIAQVGIAGDARIGDGAVLAGQSGVKERVVVGKRARVGGQAGVTHSIDDGAVVSGTPAIPHMTWLRAMAGMQRIGAMEKRIKALENRRDHDEENT